jgi:transglutaminase-like putative cysteine protease
VQVIYNEPPTTSSRGINYQAAPRIPLRENLLAPDGTVHRIPLDPKAPDAWTIISAIQFVIEQFGRDPRIRAATLPLLTSRINNDIKSHAASVAAFVMRKMIYLADPDGGEFIQTPLVLLNTIGQKGFAYGDCDDHVVLLGAMLTSVGIPARAVAVKLHGSDYYNHVVVEYPFEGRTILIDPCAKKVATPHYRDRLVAV